MKSLTAHWSLGARGSFGSSTYTNKRLYLTAAPAIEYNYFPYSESTRRSPTFQYSIGVSSFEYNEVTIYDKMSDTLPVHSVLVDVEARQPWGQVSANLNFSQYLSQPENDRVQSFGMVELRLKVVNPRFGSSGGGGMIMYY